MEKPDNLRRAIDVMTEWTTDPTGFSTAGDRLGEYISEGPDEDGFDGEMKLMFGLISLAGYLLVKLEAATGERMQSHLQDIALKSYEP
jgi:hypothetical protein